MAQPEVCAEYLPEPERYIFLFLDFQGHQHLDQGGFCRVFGEQLNAAAGDRLSVGGASAGGNLAAVVALMARDRGGPELAHQLLIYPVIDHDFDTISYREFAEGYLRLGSLIASEATRIGTGQTPEA